MAHVLLPCDLPSWPDVLSLLSRVKSCSDGRELAQIMTSIFEACRVSLDPDDFQQTEEGHPGISELCRFVQEGLIEAERNRILKDTLPELAAWAADLKRLKPAEGFLYSLRKEGGSFQLDRGFVASLLANAFFSTFPKRNFKTHPTLQDFRMADFFLYLNKRSHQKKLKAFFRYFENLGPSPRGYVTLTRKVVNGPSLPGWLCSDRPLVPLLVRPEGSVHEAEDYAYRACFCPPMIGGDVLKASTSKESKLFFCFPELLIILSFVESLEDDEALIAQGQQGGPVGFCFLDNGNFSDNASRQFEDRFLLRELNKALAAFRHDSTFTPQPVEEIYEMWNSLPNLSTPEVVSQSRRSSGSARRAMYTKRRSSQGGEKKSTSQTSSKLSMRTASESSVQPQKDDDYYTADDDSDEGSRHQDSLHRTEDTSFSRSDSMGFVLGEELDSDDSSLPQHERLEDFRKRIRKRTRRRLSRRSSRSSYLSGSSGSSDMEDISEDPEEASFQRLVLRPASSEPSIVSAFVNESMRTSLCEAAETALLSLKGHKKLMVRSSNGHLKAYSYDGVSPNLPVPFRASFRRRPQQQHSSISCWSHQESLSSPLVPKVEIEKRHKCPVAVSASECCGEEGDSQLKVTILWLAASMAELHSLILYTTQLHEVCSVYGRVVAREWTVGDLSCEVLRFCRNTLSPSQRSTHLFAQLTGHTQQQQQQQSLDLD